MIWVAAALADTPDDCAPRPPAARHVWAMTEDGRDDAGAAPGSAAGGGWFAHRDGRRVLLLPAERPATFEVTGVVLADAWTIEGSIAARSDHGEREGGPHRLLALTSRGGNVAVEVAIDSPGRYRLVGSDDPGIELPVGEYTQLRLVHTAAGGTCLWVAGQRAGCMAGPPAGSYDLTVGPPGATSQESLYVDDLAVYAVAEEGEWSSDPRCVAPIGDRPVYTEVVQDRFQLDGHYLIFGGGSTDAPVAARQRLVLAPRVDLTTNTTVRAQVRTLETRWIDLSGSPWRGSPAGAQALGDVGVSVDLAWLARSLRNPRFVPLEFAGGRLPRTFGLGTAHQNALGWLDPTPVSPGAIYDLESPRRPLGVPLHLDQTDAFLFGSALDGIQLTLGPFGRDGAVRSDGFTLVAGRRRPLCAGRTDRVCELQTSALPVYEVGLVGVAGYRRAKPAPTRLGGLGRGSWVGLDVAVQWPLEQAPGVVAVASAMAQSPTDAPVFVRWGLEGQARTGLAAAEIAPEFAGAVLGGVADLDLAVRLPAGELVVHGGAGTARSDWSDRAPAAFHPDFDVDLVGFGQLVALASAQAWLAGDAGQVPSWGGLYQGSYVRYGPTLRYRISGAWQLPIRVVHGFVHAPIGDDVVPGGLGTEVDGALLVELSEWHLGVLGGVLVPGRALPDEAGARWAGGAKVGRDF